MYVSENSKQTKPMSLKFNFYILSRAWCCKSL